MAKSGFHRKHWSFLLSVLVTISLSPAIAGCATTPGQDGNAATPRTPAQFVTTAAQPQPSYFQVLMQILAAETRYPANAVRWGEQGTAHIKATILRDGTIVDTKIEESTGYNLLDDEALDAFRRIQKFPPVPDGVAPEADKFVIRLPVTFSSR